MGRSGINASSDFPALSPGVIHLRQPRGHVASRPLEKEPSSFRQMRKFTHQRKSAGQTTADGPRPLMLTGPPSSELTDQEAIMFNCIVPVAVLVILLATSASAEVQGMYLGLRFIDSVQNTGSISGDENIGAFGVGSYTANTVGGGAFAGYDLYPQHRVPVRVEIEYAVRTNAQNHWTKFVSSKGSIDGGVFAGGWNLQTIFFNIYLDFHNSSAFTPYIGTGAGMGLMQNRYRLYLNNNGRKLYDGMKDKRNTVFAWNVGAGCSYSLNENFSLDLAWRFVGLGRNDTVIGGGHKLGMSPRANEFSVGLRFTF
jgi:opacity protein-like surface antigen